MVCDLVVSISSDLVGVKYSITVAFHCVYIIIRSSSTEIYTCQRESETKCFSSKPLRILLLRHVWDVRCAIGLGEIGSVNGPRSVGLAYVQSVGLHVSHADTGTVVKNRPVFA